MITKTYNVPMLSVTITASTGKVYTVTNPHAKLMNSGADYSIVNGTFVNNQAHYLVTADTDTHAAIVSGGEIVEVQ